MSGWRANCTVKMSVARAATKSPFTLSTRSAISVIPVLVVYVTLQQYFIQGIALTGLKG